MRKALSIGTLCVFLANTCVFGPLAQADDFRLPAKIVHSDPQLLAHRLIKDALIPSNDLLAVLAQTTDAGIDVKILTVRF